MGWSDSEGSEELMELDLEEGRLRDRWESGEGLGSLVVAVLLTVEQGEG